MTMKQGQTGMKLDVASYETAMEGEDMPAVVLTLEQGQIVPWHYHRFICLPERPDGGGDARASRHLCAERRRTLRRTAEHGASVHGLNGGPCQFMVLQGIGVYDNVRVAGAGD
jgi:hypothetical protein